MSIKPRKLANGKTVYDAVLEYGYTADGKRDRRKRTFTTKRAAELAEAKAKATRDAMRGRSGKMTLRDFIELKYWPVAVNRLAATSLDTYRREIDKRIIPNLGNLDIRDIDRAKIQRMIDKIPTYDVARKCLGTLKTILNEAKGDGLIIANPCEARYAMPPKGKKRDNGLVLSTFEDMRPLVEIVTERGSQAIQKAAMTGLLLGLRPEERYALNWESFDMDAKTVTIESAYVVASSAHGGNQLKATKTEKSNRVLPLPDAFCQWFDTLEPGSGSFIKSRKGERMPPETLKKQWRKFLADNPDAPQVTLENMRHSFATSCLHAGMNVADVSRLLGHSDISTTYKRYIVPSADDMRRSMDAVKV